MTFKLIKPKKISTQIAEQIRESILNGEFSPGEKLPPERELTEIFGVSRPSVREALNILASSGLVMSYQGGGTVVQSLIDADQDNALSELIRTQRERALEVIEVRKGMEALTAYYAATRATSEDVLRMEDILNQMDVQLKNKKPLEELDARLHLQIARATHNIIWLHLMQALFDAMKDFQRGVWRNVYSLGDDTRLLFDHHRRIVTAIGEKDAAAAREAMAEHLDFAEKRCTYYITQDPA
jgi:GntR family transcriptional regulator, transcriptional repressor for pyruvate dehydrogenase complex